MSPGSRRRLTAFRTTRPAGDEFPRFRRHRSRGPHPVWTAPPIEWTMRAMSPTQTFRSEPPEVLLVQAFARPLDNAVATARTCYSSKGIVTTEEVGGDALPEEKRQVRRERRDALAK